MRKTFLLFMSLCLACVTSFADNRSWDFKVWSETTLTNVVADANWVDAGAGTNWNYKPKMTTAAELKANSVVIEELKGLQFSSSSESRFMVDNRTGGGLRLGATGAYLHVPSCKAGDIITIVTKTAKTGEARGIKTVTNADIMEGYEMTSTEELTGKYKVIADGQVRFDPSGGVQVYSVLVEEYVASVPTITLQSGAATIAQTVYATQKIKDIVYKLGGTATGATVKWTGTVDEDTAPAGISVEEDNGTVTIKGAPTNDAVVTYTYSITATDGSTVTDPALTGSIAVKTTSKYPWCI